MKITHWLLLRGLARTNDHWLDFPEKLEAKGYKCLCLDLPGFGTQAHRQAPLSIESTTKDLRQRIRQHDWANNNWGILGLSFGGMVALDWASKHPKDFEKAVVINSSSRDVGNLFQRISPFGMYKMLEAIIQNKNSKAREKAILEMISNLKKSDLKLLGQLEAIAKKYPTTPYNFSKQLFAASRYLAPEELQTATLFLASIKDHMVDVRCSKHLAERLEKNIKFHPEAGHDLPLDDPNWVIDRIHEFAQ